MATLAQFNRRAKDLGGNLQLRAVVLTVHGIKTTGGWQKRISPILQKQAFLSVPVDYGFAKYRVLRPKKLLSEASEAVWDEYARHYDLKLPFCVIGHSFGSLTIGCLIRDNRDAKFDQVILAGCILACDFDWDQYLDSGQVNRILNEVSTDDIVVQYCKLLKIPAPSLPVGRSGIQGFDSNHSQILERNHQVLHSGVLNEVACKNTWIPFLAGQ